MVFSRVRTSFLSLNFWDANRPWVSRLRFTQIYILRTSILTVIFPQVAGFTRNSRASAPFSTKSSVLASFSQDKKQKTSLVSFFAFLVSFWACFVSPSRSTRSDYARLWPRWQRWWTALRISEKLRYQALPPAPTYTLKSTTKQDKTTKLQEDMHKWRKRRQPK